MIWLSQGQSMHVVADLSVSETSNNSLKLKTLTQSTTQADTSILAYVDVTVRIQAFVALTLYKGDRLRTRLVQSPYVLWHTKVLPGIYKQVTHALRQNTILGLVEQTVQYLFC